MSKTTLGFIFASMVYLAIGVFLGVLFLVSPGTRVLQPVHTHLNLVGFVSFLIFGVAYHILPRFRGRPLRSEALAWGGFWVANIGLIGLALFLGLRAYYPQTDFTAGLAISGSVLVLSVYLFIYNLGRTLI